MHLTSHFWENNRSQPALITLCEVLCRPAQVSTKSLGRENISAARKDRLEYVESHWKGSKIYRFSRSTTQNFLCRPTIMAYIFEDFEAPSKKILATPLKK